MSIVLMTRNRKKIPEYLQFFSRHGQAVHVEEPTEAPEALAAFLRSHLAVLADESNVYDPSGDLVGPAYAGPARNVCRLHAWILRGSPPVRLSYLREIAGRFEASRPASGTLEVFDWDAAFLPLPELSLHDMREAGLKNSARERCLSAFAEAFLKKREPRKLRWTHVAPDSIVDWDADARLLLEHPICGSVPAPLINAARHVINRGIFFRSAIGRRDGNYWLPGLNGGLPYVPKGDPVHEATYLWHDLMHHLMPDLVFDGDGGEDHRRTYIAWRMMSEAVSLVLADMLFADALSRRPEHANYGFDARRIHPLYRETDPARTLDARELLVRMVRYVLLGDRRGFPTGTAAWEAFESKYARFFIGDFQWTRMNWSSLVARDGMSRRWIDLLGRETFRRQGLETVSDAVAAVGRGHPVPALAERLFDHVWTTRLAPALACGEPADVERSSSEGFRRWLTGQCALFARYAPLVGLPPLAHALAARLRDPRPFDAPERRIIRADFSAHVRSMADGGLISDDDASIFPDLFPLFDPFFLRDYDRAEQEFATVEEASAFAFGGGGKETP